MSSPEITPTLDETGPFAELSRLVLSDIDVETMLARVAELSADAISGCDAAGVTLIQNGVPSTAAQSDPLVEQVDAYQYEAASGPCLDAAKLQRPFRIESTLEEERWPEFCKRAAAAGIMSSYSVPLAVKGEGVGALNCYSKRIRGFDEADEAMASIFAAQASVAIVNAQLYTGSVQLTQQLYQALQTRGVIERAKGILMQREGYTEEQAFETLRNASQRLNIKLHDIALQISESTAPK